MLANLTPFLLHWAITAFGLWVASHVFKGLRFGSTSALVVAALLLGLAGLGAFMWALKSGQFDDLDGAANRVLRDDDLPEDPVERGGVRADRGGGRGGRDTPRRR